MTTLSLCHPWCCDHDGHVDGCLYDWPDDTPPLDPGADEQNDLEARGYYGNDWSDR